LALAGREAFRLGSEITKRKGIKLCSGRLDRAVDLLRAIDLAPPAPAAA
jgi:hypothetical protein